MFKKIVTIAVVVLVFVFAFALSPFAKEPNPFQGEFRPEKITARVGSTVALVLQFESLAKFDKAELFLNVPKGLKLVSGNASAVMVDLKPHEKKVFKFQLRVEEKGEKRLLATVKALGLSPHQAYGQAFIAIINPSKEPLDRSVVKTEKDGTKVRVITVPKSR